MGCEVHRLRVFGELNDGVVRPVNYLCETHCAPFLARASPPHIWIFFVTCDTECQRFRAAGKDFKRTDEQQDAWLWILSSAPGPFSKRRNRYIGE